MFCPCNNKHGTYNLTQVGITKKFSTNLFTSFSKAKFLAYFAKTMTFYIEFLEIFPNMLVCIKLCCDRKIFQDLNIGLVFPCSELFFHLCAWYFHLTSPFKGEFSILPESCDIFFLTASEVFYLASPGFAMSNRRTAK